MKTQTYFTVGCMRDAAGGQLVLALLLLPWIFIANGMAQDKYTTANGIPMFAHAHFAASLPALTPAPATDEFQSELEPSPEVSSINMAGWPAGTLPCTEHGRFEEDDAALAATTTSPTTVAAAAASRDHFLVDKILAVQRMVSLMKLKEEIMLERERFERALAELEQTIATR